MDQSSQVAPRPENGENRDIWSLLERFTRLGFIVIGVLYTVGLLIVNCDLGRYGIIHLDFARTEYILAGALWVFLIMIVWTFSHLCLTSGKDAFARGNSWFERVTSLGTLLFCPFGLSYVLGILSENKITIFNLETGTWWFNLDAMPAIIAIAANALIVWSTAKKFRPIAGKLSLVLRQQMQLSSFWDPLYNLAILLSLLGFFSVAAYPRFPREFGGGRRPLVKLLLSDNAHLSDSFGLPMSSDGKSIGPVLLLRQTDGVFIVTRDDTTGETVWTRKPVTAVGIDKAFISAISYNPPAK